MIQRIVVYEFGKYVYGQTLCGASRCSKESNENYEKYSDYFKQLLETVAQYLDGFELVLETTKKHRLMSLTLKEEQMQKAEAIKRLLLTSFPDKIEQIVFKKTKDGGILNIYDTVFKPIN